MRAPLLSVSAGYHLQSCPAVHLRRFICCELPPGRQRWSLGQQRGHDNAYASLAPCKRATDRRSAANTDKTSIGPSSKPSGVGAAAATSQQGRQPSAGENLEWGNATVIENRCVGQVAKQNPRQSSTERLRTRQLRMDGVCPRAMYA